VNQIGVAEKFHRDNAGQIPLLRPVS